MAEDYGLLGGLAAGLQSGVESYRTARRDSREEEKLLAAQKRQQMLDAIAAKKDELSRTNQEKNFELSKTRSGLTENPEGGFMLTDEARERRDLDDKVKHTLLGQRLSDAPQLAPGEKSIKSLPKDKQIIVEKTAGDVAKNQQTLNMFDEIMDQLDDPNLDEKDKQNLMNEQLKILNSMMGSDALGSSETKRVGSYLSVMPDPLGPKGMKVGADVPKAIEQFRAARNRVAGGLESSKKEIDSIVGRKSSGGLMKSAPPPKTETKEVDGVQYRRVKGGWEAVE